MALIRLLAPWLTGISIAVLYFFASREPSFIPWMGAASVALVAAAALVIVRAPTRSEWLHLSLTPALFVVSSWAFWFFINPPSILPAVSAAIGILLSIYFLACWYYYSRPAQYQPSAIDNTATYAHLVSIFFLSTAASGFFTLLSQPLWLVTGVIGLYAALSGYLVFWMNNIWERTRLLTLIAIALVFTEFFALISTFSFSVFVRGFLSAWVFYALTGLVRSRVLYGLNKKIVSRYMVTSAIAAVVALFAARID